MKKDIRYEYYCLPCSTCKVVPELCGCTGFKCPVCGKTHSVHGGIEFAIKNWNSYNSNIPASGDRSNFPSITIRNEEWYWGELEVGLYSLGSKREYYKTFIMFKTSKPSDEWFIDKKTGWTCIIDKPRYLPDLEILDIQGNQVEVDWLNMPKSSCKAYAYITEYRSGFAETTHPQVCIHTLSPKYDHLAQELIKVFNPTFDFYNHEQF